MFQNFAFSMTTEHLESFTCGTSSSETISSRKQSSEKITEQSLTNEIRLITDAGIYYVIE